jgi:hypothetical protein
MTTPDHPPTSSPHEIYINPGGLPAYSIFESDPLTVSRRSPDSLRIMAALILQPGRAPGSVVIYAYDEQKVGDEKIENLIEQPEIVQHAAQQVSIKVANKYKALGASAMHREEDKTLVLTLSHIGLTPEFPSHRVARRVGVNLRTYGSEEDAIALRAFAEKLRFTPEECLVVNDTIERLRLALSPEPVKAKVKAPQSAGPTGQGRGVSLSLPDLTRKSGRHSK